MYWCNLNEITVITQSLLERYEAYKVKKKKGSQQNNRMGSTNLIIKK